jgi:enamine deaminase RidA (YjgF/YER057c/UK114 family)
MTGRRGANALSVPEFLVPDGYGRLMHERRHYSQGVRVGPFVIVAGQGGWTDELRVPDDHADELRLAFRNVGTVLAAAGSSWSDVIEVTSYHVDLDAAALDGTAQLLREHCPGHEPLWTVLGVARLARVEMRVEITARAFAQPIDTG